MHELKLMDVQKKYKDKEAVRKFNYTFTNTQLVFRILIVQIDYSETVLLFQDIIPN